jgi:hypothetical protein
VQLKPDSEGTIETILFGEESSRLTSAETW